MLIGYARVSTDDQNLDLQRDALQAAGCERIFEDMVSGAKADRTGMTEMLTIWKRMQAQRRRAHALDVLKTHGLTPVLYIPTVGSDDADLREALDEFAL